MQLTPKAKALDGEVMGRTLKAPKPHGREPALAKGKPLDGYTVAGRLWLEKDGQTWLAWGRVVLLERIRDSGSILAAAKSMNMSYRHAWELVEELNRLAPSPLVEREAGGKGGGGTRLTREGEQAVETFWEMTEQFSKWLHTRKPVRRPKRPRRSGA